MATPDEREQLGPKREEDVQAVLQISDSGDAAKKAAARLYEDAHAALTSGQNEEAIRLFRSLEDGYPYLELARQSKLGVAFALFLDGEYEDAIEELDLFTEYHPANKNVDYAYYLKAASYYQWSAARGRDARSGRLALGTLDVFLRRFPDSPYADDASTKAREVADRLAANHLSIGRFYQARNEFLAAIKRFQLVIRDYPETSQTPEALHRLVECFTALGVIDEAQQTARFLASNFPRSDWSREAQTLLASVAPTPAYLDDIALASSGITSNSKEVVHDQGEAANVNRKISAVGAPSLIDGIGTRASIAESDIAIPDRGFGSAEYRASSTEMALLRRRMQTAETEGSGNDIEMAIANSPISAAGDFDAFGDEDWQQQLEARSEQDFPGGVSLAVGHNYVGRRYREDNTFGPMLIDQGYRWETVNDTTVEIGLLGDRLKLTSLQSLSRILDADLGDEVVMGQGYFQGLEADILEGDSFSLSVSGSYGITDNAYGSAEDDDDEDDEDEDSFVGIPDPGAEAINYGLEAGFALPFADLSLSHDKSRETGQYSHEEYNRLVSDEYAVGLGFNTLDLSLSYNRSLETEGRGEDRERRRAVGYSAEVDYEVQALRHILGGAFGDTFWEFAPDFISAKYGIERGKTSGEGRDEKTDLDVTASWNWKGGYTSLSYYYSFLDDRAGSGDNDYRTEGLDIGAGLYGSRWSLYGGLSLDRSASLGQWSKSVELGFDPYLSFSYQPENWPDLSVSGSTSHYQADYIADNGTSMNRSWEVLTELNFAKFWSEALDSEYEGLKLFVQITGDRSSEKWSGEADKDSNLDYFVGLKMNVNLGE